MNKKPSIILIVEDDPAVKGSLKRVFAEYAKAEEMRIVTAKNATEAFQALGLSSEDGGERPDALILDLMMPYGGDADVKKALRAELDEDERETGVRLLNHLKHEKKAFSHLVWIAVITARNAVSVLNQVQKMLSEKGRVYTKPFNDIELEYDLAVVLGIEPRVESLLLPPDYTPPKPKGE